jgi:hypothetical protein
MSSLLHDFRYALRQIRHNPGFSAFVMITLALAVGANTMIFSMLEAAVLHPLPFHDARGIMALRATDAQPGGELSGLAAVTDPNRVLYFRRLRFTEARPPTLRE